MKEKLGVEAELVAGRGGVFDVIVDGELVYSKSKTRMFPDNRKLVGELVLAYLGG